MGLFTSFDTKRVTFDTNSSDARLVIDLSKFIIGGTPLGKLPWEGDFFAASLAQSDTLTSEPLGYELGLKRGLLNYAFITLARFQGVFLRGEQALPLSPETTRAEVIAAFGEPYWIDQEDGEIILFYEYRRGEIELQFELSDGEHLTYLTLAKNGVLSKPEQRKSYRVTKPWPPKD